MSGINLGEILGGHPPAWVLGGGAIIVGGKRIEPAKITAAGYQFRFPDVEPALRHIIDQEPVT